jgi:carbon-monoxide dehydrogenase small subunit
MDGKHNKELIELTVNGESHELAVEPQETLLEVLRDSLGLTGTKEGCGTGECGSCAVLVDGEPVLSCLKLAVDCEQNEIVTIEGLSRGGGLTSVQEAFLECGAVQCGFCTPGMVLAATALLETTPQPSPREIKKALEGHLCRCTGYNKIVEAVVKAAALKMGDLDKDILSQGYKES